ncbi:MAG: TIGR03905 family TSCPD domain-containing protein [Butyrivibrio sp.]|uniref:TIGR03905 family TSCPD domain-containing protein n=1 Tax=Butyrivibrio sp. NC2002 TaxID=1410610 RepID=UPI000568E372|nr:TIGR03905 family TSCPD domain-containing protein [Butyrivibrio sp. NC2002]MBE5860464.1 TIGR03905 family TSCPD domain-containing protein [Butyrivibrio sp.]
MQYKTKGTCATQINVELDGNIIKSVSFVNGCSGNTQGVARLVEGMDANDAIKKLRGIKCGFKSTSCPDQLSYALEQALNA